MGHKPRQPAGGVPRLEVPETVYVLKQVSKDMTAYNGFKWPESGMVEAPDWDPTPMCGSGLHGWLRGEGDGSFADNSPDAKWLILKVNPKDIVFLKGKVKFPRAEVIACGSRHEIVAEMRSLCPDASVIYSTVAKTDRQAASAGSYGQASAGSYGQASAGYRGQASAGDGGQASAGEKGCIIVRYYDANADRYRVAVGYVDETLDVEGKTLERGVKYRLNSNSQFERVQ